MNTKLPHTQCKTLDVQDRRNQIGQQIHNQPVHIRTIHHGQQNIIGNIRLLQIKPSTSTAQNSFQLPSILTFYPQNNIMRDGKDHDKWIHWENGTAANHLGGIYKQGKPIPEDVREKMVQLDAQGITHTQISNQLKIPQSTVHTILKKYQQTGSIKPCKPIHKGKVITPLVTYAINTYISNNPGITARQVKDKLLEDCVCYENNVPSLTIICKTIQHIVFSKSYNS